MCERDRSFRKKGQPLEGTAGERSLSQRDILVSQKEKSLSQGQIPLLQRELDSYVTEGEIYSLSHMTDREIYFSQREISVSQKEKAL